MCLHVEMNSRMCSSFLCGVVFCLAVSQMLIWKDSQGSNQFTFMWRVWMKEKTEESAAESMSDIRTTSAYICNLLIIENGECNDTCRVTLTRKDETVRRDLLSNLYC